MTHHLKEKVAIEVVSGRLNEEQPVLNGRFKVPSFIEKLLFKVHMPDCKGRLALQLFDPIQNRGFFATWIKKDWGNTFELMISREEAPRGWEKGPIVAGEWRLQVSGIPLNGETPFIIEIDGIKQNVETRYQWTPGDLHSHTNHSDGAYSIEELIAAAKEEELQFLAVTDHNTMTAFTELNQIDFCILKGTEITTERGHANLFGIERMPEWYVDGNSRSFTHVAKETKLQQGLFSINHPFIGELGWIEWDMDLSYVDCIEIWNNPGYVKSTEAMEKALVKWNELLNSGYRITGIGGSDSVHYGFDYEHRLGYPTTYLLLEKVTDKDILKALKEGRAIVSKESFIYSEVWLKGQKFFIGDQVQVGTVHKSVKLRGYSAFSGINYVQWVKNGEVINVKEVTYKEEVEEEIDVTAGDWIRMQVRNEKGDMQAFTNPIYFVR